MRNIVARLKRFWSEISTGGALAIRLVMAIIVFSAVSTVIITAIQSYIQYTQEAHNIKTRFAELQQLQVPVLTESVWVYEEGQIASQLDGITRLPNIETARILMADEAKWSSGTASSKRTLIEKFPLIKDKEEIGKLEVVVSMDSVYQRLTNNALAILLQNALLTLVISGFALVLFQKSVTLHLFRMADYTQHLDIGKSDTPDFQLERKRMGQPDVLDQLVLSLNTMRHNLSTAYHELATYTAELAESKKKFTAIFHSSPIALSVSRFDGNYTIIDVNEAWVRQFGMECEAVIGRDNREPAFWSESEDCEAVLTTVEQSGVIRRYEAWRKRGDSEFLLCEISARLFDVGSERLLLLAEEDITEKRKIELEIRDLNSTLEERVQMRTAELQAAMENLKKTQNELLRSEKLAALGSLVAGVAHELNTPIGNSVMVASTLSQQTAGLNQAINAGLKRSMLETYLNDASNATDIILRNLNRAAELITSFKQVAVDQTSSQRRLFSLREVVSEIVVTLRPTIKKTPYKIEFEISENIQMDSFPGPLGQVITNLINNAIIHGFDGGPKGTILITARKLDEEKVELKLGDDGKGIDAANLGRIFDPFFTTKLGKGGSGLGLNIVYTIVTGVLGGNIAVNSEIGKGTAFTLALPIIGPQLAAASEA